MIVRYRYDRGSSTFILTEPEERQLFLNAAILGYPMTVPDPSADHISSEVPRVGGEKVADTSIRHPGTVRGTGPAEKLAFVDTLTTTCRCGELVGVNTG